MSIIPPANTYGEDVSFFRVSDNGALFLARASLFSIKIQPDQKSNNLLIKWLRESREKMACGLYNGSPLRERKHIL